MAQENTPSLIQVPSIDYRSIKNIAGWELFEFDDYFTITDLGSGNLIEGEKTPTSEILYLFKAFLGQTSHHERIVCNAAMLGSADDGEPDFFPIEIGGMNDPIKLLQNGEVFLTVSFNGSKFTYYINKPSEFVENTRFHIQTSGYLIHPIDPIYYPTLEVKIDKTSGGEFSADHTYKEIEQAYRDDVRIYFYFPSGNDEGLIRAKVQKRWDGENAPVFVGLAGVRADDTCEYATVDIHNTVVCGTTAKGR